MNLPAACATVRVLTTHWLDRRLAPAARARVELHLRGCPECRAEYRALARLARAVAQLPRNEPSPMAARRAVQRAARRDAAAPSVAGSARPSPNAWAWRAAAGLLVALALGATWQRGGAHERRVAPLSAAPVDPRIPEVVERAPVDVPSEAPTPLHEVDDATLYARAARSVLADVAAIDEVAPPLRQPLLGAQIRVFGLDAWAARPARSEDGDAPLVGLVRRLEEALASGDDAALLALQRTLQTRDGAVLAAAGDRPRAARATAPRARLEVPGFTRAQADAVVGSFAGLPSSERAPLSDLLEAKASWIAGDLDASRARAHESGEAREPRDGRGGFAAAYRVLFVLSSAERGAAGESLGTDALEALKTQVNRALEDALDEALRRLPVRPRAPAGGPR